MKKVLSLLLASLMLVGVLAACGDAASSSSSQPGGTSSASSGGTSSSVPADTGEPEGVVDGKFTETRHITVEVFERPDTPILPNLDENVYLKWIKDSMLEQHNVEVEWKVIGRWDEDPNLPSWIAANEVPDVAYTYNKAAVDGYALDGGVWDLAALFNEYDAYIQDLKTLLDEEVMMYDLDPATGEMFTMETQKFNDAHQKTYVREDWLAALNMAPPSTLEEFEAYLRAVKENADTLPGNPGASVIPLMVTVDVGWTILDLAESVIPSDMTDKEEYVYGWDDRLVMYRNYKSAVEIVNRWYNEGLIWPDFALYPKTDTTTPNDLTKSGFVGAMMQNVDVPYRADYELQVSMQTVTPDAAFIPVPTFKNADGNYYKLWNAPTDRKVFIPKTCEEPLAALMYINFISKYDTIKFLQFGPEGVGHTVNADGSFTMLNPPEGDPYARCSSQNIDFTMTCNSIQTGDKTMDALSMATAYTGIDPSYIIQMMDTAPYTIDIKKNASAGVIDAEGSYGAGLVDIRDAFLSRAVTASVEDFSQVFDDGLAEYMAAGGAEIIAEREAAWVAVHGDAENI